MFVTFIYTWYKYWVPKRRFIVIATSKVLKEHGLFNAKYSARITQYFHCWGSLELDKAET